MIGRARAGVPIRPELKFIRFRVVAAVNPEMQETLPRSRVSARNGLGNQS